VALLSSNDALKLFVVPFLGVLIGCSSKSNRDAEDITLCKQGWSATEAGQHKLAIELFNSCIQTGNLGNQSLSKTFRNIGIAHRRSGNPEASIPYYNKALALNPPDPWNDLINRGNSWDECGLLDNAINDYNAALALKPNFGEAYYNKGIAYERQRKTKDALLEFQNAYNHGLRTPLLLERLSVYAKMNRF
jgi:tetratricopeptide (TPR) repeat protein